MIWAGVVTVLLAAWIVESLIWPYATCRRCNGRGKFASPVTRSWRSCRRCGGSGRRIRVGRALLQMVGVRPSRS